MTIEIAILFALILVLIVLFAFEVFPPDMVALTCMVSLILFGFVSPDEGISGLSNRATVTVLALMVLSVGLETTGVISLIGKKMEGLFSRGEAFGLFILMFIVGAFSAFIATTAVVIVFMRMLFKMSEKIPIRLSRILMPLSFAGILGGSCTLLGTSTNILVNAIARDYQLQPFSVFEFTHIGGIFFAIGIIYIVFFGRHLLPKGEQVARSLTAEYALQDFLIELVVLPDSVLVGLRVDQSIFFRSEELDLFEIQNPGEKPHFPSEQEVFEPGHILFIKGTVEQIAELRKSYGLALPKKKKQIGDERFMTGEMTLCEVIIPPNSRFIGRPIDKIVMRREFGAIPLAVKKSNKYVRRRPGKVKIEAGDVVLMEVAKRSLDRMFSIPEFVVLQHHEHLSFNKHKQVIASAILIMVIALAALNVLSILVSALLGCVLMVLTGCLKMQEAYKNINWSVIILLAGVIPLGIAMDNVGASSLIADKFVQVFGTMSPYFIVASLFAVTAGLSAVVSNNATAVLMAPIAVSIATSIQLDPRPLLMTVMFAANTSYISPIGYQTNTLVYAAGEYQFKDFVRVGGILTVLIWIAASIVIPFFLF